MQVVTRDNGYEKIEAQGLSAAEAERLGDQLARRVFGPSESDPSVASCRRAGVSPPAWAAFGYAVEVRQEPCGWRRS